MLRFKAVDAVRCRCKAYAHSGFIRLSCPDSGHYPRVVGLWLHVGSRLYLMGPKHLVKEIR